MEKEIMNIERNRKTWKEVMSNKTRKKERKKE